MENKAVIQSYESRIRSLLVLVQDLRKQPYPTKNRVDSLVDLYEQTRVRLVAYLQGSEAMMEYIPKLGTGYYLNEEGHSKLENMVVNCNSILGYLDNVLESVPKEVKDKLETLRKAIESVETNNPNLFKHLEKAIDEYESGHYLPSGLLAGKASVYMIEQLTGKDDQEKVDSLISKGLINKNLKDKYLKAIKKARNYFAHDISAIPEPTEALGLVSDSCDLALKLIGPQ